MNLNELSKQVHSAHIKWWQDPATGQPIQRNQFELLALAISELSEMLEGVRKNLMDDHLPNRRMEEVEAADFAIRILDFAGGFKLELVEIAAPSPELLHPNKGQAIFFITHYLTKFPTEQAYALSYSLFLIRSYCAQHGLDLEGAMTEKLAFNAQREDHKHKARLIAGGKRF